MCILLFGHGIYTKWTSNRNLNCSYLIHSTEPYHILDLMKEEEIRWYFVTPNYLEYIKHFFPFRSPGKGQRNSFLTSFLISYRSGWLLICFSRSTNSQDLEKYPEKPFRSWSDSLWSFRWRKEGSQRFDLSLVDSLYLINMCYSEWFPNGHLDSLNW